MVKINSNCKSDTPTIHLNIFKDEKSIFVSLGEKKSRLFFNSNTPVHLIQRVHQAFIECFIDKNGNVSQLKLFCEQNILLTTFGKIKVEQLEATGNVEVRACRFTNKGTVRSDQAIEISTRDGVKNRSGASIRGNSVNITSSALDNELGTIDGTCALNISTLGLNNKQGLLLSINDICIETLKGFGERRTSSWEDREAAIKENPDLLRCGLLYNNEGVIRALGRLKIKAYGGISNEFGIIFSGKKGSLFSDLTIRNKKNGLIKSREKLKIVALGPILNHEGSKIFSKSEMKIESKECFISNKEGKIRAGAKLIVHSDQQIDNTKGEIHSAGLIKIEALAGQVLNLKGIIESGENLTLLSKRIWNTTGGRIQATYINIQNDETFYNFEGNIESIETLNFTAHSLHNEKGRITAKKIVASIGFKINAYISEFATSFYNPYHKREQQQTSAEESLFDQNQPSDLDKMEGHLINIGGIISGEDEVNVVSKGEIFNTDKGLITSQRKLKMRAEGRIFNDYESQMRAASKVDLVAAQGTLVCAVKSQIKAETSLKTKAVIVYNLEGSEIVANGLIDLKTDKVWNCDSSKIISTRGNIGFHAVGIENTASLIHAAAGFIFAQRPERFINFGGTIESLTDLEFNEFAISSWPAYRNGNWWRNANAVDEDFKRKYRTYIENGSDGQVVDGYIFYKPGTISTSGSILLKNTKFKSFEGNFFAGKEIVLATDQPYSLKDTDTTHLKCQRLFIKATPGIWTDRNFVFPFAISLEGKCIVNKTEWGAKGKIKIKVLESLVQNIAAAWIKAQNGLTVRARRISNFVGKISCIGKCHLIADDIQWGHIKDDPTPPVPAYFMWEGPASWGDRKFSNLGGGPVEAPFSFSTGDLRESTFLAVDGPFSVKTRNFNNFGGFILVKGPSLFQGTEHVRNNFGRIFIIGDATVHSPQFVNVMLFNKPSSIPAYFNVEGKLTLASLQEGFNISSSVSARDGIWIDGRNITRAYLPNTFFNVTHPTISEVMLHYDRKLKGQVLDKIVGVYPQPLASISSAHSINVDVTGFLQNIGIMHAPDIHLNVSERVSNRLVKSSPFSGNPSPIRIPFIDILREQALDGVFQFSENPKSSFVMEPVVPFSFARPSSDRLIVHRPQDPPLETIKPLVSPIQERWLLLLALQKYGHTTYLPGAYLYYQVEEFHGRKGLLPVLNLSPHLLLGTGIILGDRIRIQSDVFENSASVKAHELFHVKAREMVVFTETKVALDSVNSSRDVKQLTPYLIPETVASIEANNIELHLDSLSATGAKIVAEKIFKADVRHKAVVQALQTQEIVTISKKVSTLAPKFIPADILSTGAMDWDVGSFEVKGSNLRSIQRLRVFAKAYVDITDLSGSRITQWEKKRSFKGTSYRSQSIQQTQTIVQRSMVQSMIEDVNIQTSHLTGAASTLAAGRDVILQGSTGHLKGKVYYNQGKERSSKAAFFKVSHQRTKIQSPQIEPFIVVTGRNFIVSENERYEEEGVIVRVGGDVNQEVLHGDLITKGLAPVFKTTTKGRSIGVRFFGSEALSQLSQGHAGQSVLALAQEDPLVARLHRLYQQKRTVDILKQTIRAAIQTNQLVKDLSQNGTDAFASRWQMTSITVSYQQFKQKISSQLIFPSQYGVEGGITRRAAHNQEVLDGAQFRAQKDVLFEGHNQLIFKYGTETHHTSNSSLGVSMSFQFNGVITDGSVQCAGSQNVKHHYIPVAIQTPGSIILRSGSELLDPQVVLAAPDDSGHHSSYHMGMGGSASSVAISAFGLGVEYNAKSDFPLIIEWDKGIIVFPRLETDVAQPQPVEEKPQKKKTKPTIVIEPAAEAHRNQISKVSKKPPVERQKKENPQTLVFNKKTPSEKPKEVSFHELLFEEDRLMTLGTHIAARVGAMTYDGLNHAIHEGTKTTVDAITLFYQLNPVVRTVKYGIQKACQINPQAQKACHTIAKKVSDTPKRLIQTMKQSVPQFLKQAVSDLSAHRNKRIEDFARINEQLYGIAPDMTRQYHQDASTFLANTALFAVPIGGASKLAQRIFKGITSTAPKAAASTRFTLINPEQPKILSTTIYEIETRNEDIRFIISALNNKTSVAYVGWIENHTTNPLLSRVITQIKNAAISQGSTKLEIEFHITNRKLLQMFHRNFEFRSSSTLNHLGKALEEKFAYISCHKFAIPLKNPNPTSVLSFHSSEPEMKHLFISPPEIQLPALYVPKQTSVKVLPDKNITSFYSDHLFKYFTMSPEELALKTANQPINIHDPKSFQTVANKLYEVIKDPQDTPAVFVIGEKAAELEHLLPDFTHRSQNTQSLWMDLIRDKTRNSSGAATIKYIRDDDTRFLCAQLRMGQSSFIVKDYHESQEILAEWMGLDFLHSLQLKHLQIPELIAIGKYQPAKFDKRFFIIKTHLNGRTPDTMMKEMGKLPASSSERRNLHQEMIKLSDQAGKVLGELQNKGLQSGQTAYPSKQCTFWEDRLEEVITDVNDLLSELKIQKFKTDSMHLQKLIQDFKNDPGALSYGLSDVHGEQFSYLEGKLGFFDMESVVRTVDGQRNPLEFVSAEYSNFRKMFEVTGLIHDLTLEEIGAYQRSFSKGYFSEYTRTHSRAASRFFEFFDDLDTIASLASSARSHEYKNIEMIKSLVSKTKKKLKTVE